MVAERIKQFREDPLHIEIILNRFLLKFLSPTYLYQFGRHHHIFYQNGIEVFLEQSEEEEEEKRRKGSTMRVTEMTTQKEP
jgi:hypothetical protein